MNSKSNERLSTPKIVVYMKSPDGKTCQAAWYGQAVEATAKVYGNAQGFNVLEIRADQVDQVRATLLEGAPASKGLLTLNALKPEALDRLLAALSVGSTNTQAAVTKPLADTTTIPAKGSSSPACHPSIDPLWAALTVNMVVLAPELSDDGVPDGWWEAVITLIQGDMLTLRFRDYPEQAAIRRKREQLAIMYPPPVRV